MSVNDGDISQSPVVELAGGLEPATAGPSDGESQEPPQTTERPLDRKALTVLLVQHFSK